MTVVEPTTNGLGRRRLRAGARRERCFRGFTGDRVQRVGPESRRGSMSRRSQNERRMPRLRLEAGDGARRRRDVGRSLAGARPPPVRGSPGARDRLRRERLSGRAADRRSLGPRRSRRYSASTRTGSDDLPLRRRSAAQPRGSWSGCPGTPAPSGRSRRAKAKRSTGARSPRRSRRSARAEGGSMRASDLADARVAPCGSDRRRLPRHHAARDSPERAGAGGPGGAGRAAALRDRRTSIPDGPDVAASARSRR